MSDNAPSTPIVAASSNDEIEGALVAAPDSSINFAEDRATAEWIAQHVGPLLYTVRAERMNQHVEWGQIRRMAQLVRDDTSRYNGQSEVYLPVYQKARETRVSHLSRGLFPTDPYIDCQSEDPSLDANSHIVKAWMMHQLDKASVLRAELKPFLRSMTDYGLAVGKAWWEKPVNPLKTTRMTKLPGIAQMLHSYGSSSPWSNEGCRFKARSVFSWYVWPTSVNSIDEASLVFEDIQTSKQFVDQMCKAGIWKDPDVINAASNLENLNPELRTMQGEVRGTTNTAVDVRQGDLANWTLLTECWLRMPVPAGMYAPNEEKGTPVPCKVVLSGNNLLEVRRNPFWHQKPPYVMQRVNEQTDSFYTTGMGRAMLTLQGFINDIANQTNDNGMYALNPIIKYNPNLVVGPLEPLAPGRMFPLTDVTGMVFDRPPVEQLQYGMQLTNQFINYANDMTGVPAVLQGSGTKGGAKTATGSQILQGNVKGELQDLIEDMEQRVLMPLMKMFHSLGQQYESAERYLAISGGEKVQFNRDMLNGEFNWSWVASSQASNQQQRAAQSLQFLQAVANPLLLQLLMQQGKSLQPEYLLRTIYESGLGMRNFDRVIAPMQMMPGLPGGGGPPGAPPQAGQPPGGEPRSAVEQAPGGSGPMAPGEGEDFNQMRAGADAMAGSFGMNSGMGWDE